jgi:hypothetical protein
MLALLKAQYPNGAFPQVWTRPVAAPPILKASYPACDWRTEGRVDNLEPDPARAPAEMLKLLLDTRRYRPGTKLFQLVVDVDLDDGEIPPQVEVEFLAPREVKLKRNRPRLLAGFRVLQADACATAFREPVEVSIEGPMVNGARNPDSYGPQQ